jgi:hypothetical protein
MKTTMMPMLMLTLAKDTSMVALPPRLLMLPLHPHCRRRNMTSKMLAMMISQAEAAGQLVGVAVLEFGVVLHR